MFFREIFWSVLFGIIFVSQYGVQNEGVFSIVIWDLCASLIFLVSYWHLRYVKWRIRDREARREKGKRFHRLMTIIWAVWSLIYFILFWNNLHEIQKEHLGVILFLSCSLFPKFVILLTLIGFSVILCVFLAVRRRHPEDEHVRGRGLDFLGSDTLISVLANSPFLESSESCAICLESYQEGESLRKMPCQHTFHKDCVDHWLESRTTCPYCRMDLRSNGGEDLVHSRGEGVSQV